MGCDIHVHVEVLVEGKWEHYSNPYVRRNYTLFAKLANVREIDPTGLGDPRGFPERLSKITDISWQLWKNDGHSVSWITREEAGAIQTWWQVNCENNEVFGYVFGNDVGYLPVWISDLGVTDTRVVFWFDN